MATAEPLKAFGYLLFRQGRFSQAALVFANVACDTPDDPYPHEALGAIYLALGRPLEAVLAYTQALAVGPEREDLLARRAEALVGIGETEAARADWERARRGRHAHEFPRQPGARGGDS